jgi:Delta7-sterol 5-desaturase
LTDHSFGFYSAAFFCIILLRYFLVAGAIYLVFYLPIVQTLINRHLIHQFPSWLSIQHDINLSILSTGVFALTAATIMLAYNNGYTLLYSHPQQYRLWYLGVSYVAVLILQDTYFFFTHRLCHHPLLFRWLHKGHHQSRYPTPLTSFAFDPLDAVTQSLFLVAIVFVIPLHFITLIAILTTMTIWSVLNHLELILLPTSFPHHWLGRWFIGPSHHSIHHLKHTVHYGLYFTFWDNIFGTQDSNYIRNISRVLVQN